MSNVPAARHVLIDTREQNPLIPAVWRAQAWEPLPHRRATLPEGDYQIEGIEGMVAVERKSISDLYGTLYGSTLSSSGERLGSLDRFRRELERLRPYARKWLLIEGTPHDFDLYIFDRSRRVQPIHAHALLDAIGLDYDIEIIFAGDRLRAASKLGNILGRIIAQIDDPKARKKLRDRGLARPWCPAIPPAPTPAELEEMCRES